ncbi:hypothetical protein ACM64Y_07940 [Novispirillum sp. DQ9]|uniref:hypothetical protein n=1 Tax=Novispirillum sp. DQ9 TaxID=3398612 RepID=UPI003C7AB5DF
MKTVYYKAGDAEWKYELDDEEFDGIVQALTQENADLEGMVDEALDILRELSAMDEEELTDDDIVDQTLAIAVLWHYFNSREADAFDGDIVVIDNGDEEGATILSAKDILEQE